jgi:hypothetical protein
MTLSSSGAGRPALRRHRARRAGASDVVVIERDQPPAGSSTSAFTTGSGFSSIKSPSAVPNTLKGWPRTPPARGSDSGPVRWSSTLLRTAAFA